MSDRPTHNICEMIIVLAMLALVAHGCHMMHEQDLKKMEIQAKEKK